jgi:molybdopterin/thiamine biosynthesis adenylyltransferase
VANDETFSRERLAGYNPEALARGVALVVGAGALGQNTAQNLALGGVGEIRLVDRDQFEEHNRTRSPAYPLPEEQEVYGMGKARAVALKLRRVMTAQRPVMRYANAWVQELGDGAFDGVSVVVSCVDSPLARAYLSDKARQHGLPLVEGGFHAADITLTAFPAVPPEEAWGAPCWRCSHPDLGGSYSCRTFAAQSEAAGIIPAVQNAAAVLGGLQAEAAVLAIHPSPDVPREARSYSLNIRTHRGLSFKLSRAPNCGGLHSALEGEPVALRTTADDTVGQLLGELTDRFGCQARLQFPLKLFAKLFWTPACPGKGCENIADVRGPEWLWRMNPRCEECGGPFPVLRGAPPGAAPYYPELSPESDTEILSATCRQVGLPPLSLVTASGEGSSTTNFRLAGSPADLFESGDAYER